MEQRQDRNFLNEQSFARSYKFDVLPAAERSLVMSPMTIASLANRSGFAHPPAGCL